MNVEKQIDQRLMPRYPLPKEKIKFFFEDGEKVFGVQDISVQGIGINLLEHGESLLFPINYQCRAELRLNKETLLVDVCVARVSAWTVGFTFENLTPEIFEKIENLLDPIAIGQSLRLVTNQAGHNDFENISRWYHGDSATDIFFWHDVRGGVNKALFCFGENFWEWTDDSGVRTGQLERTGDERAKLIYDTDSQLRLRDLAHNVLDHADAIDSRLRIFLQEENRKRVLHG